MERIIILSILIAHSLGAPSGCIESCNTYQSSSYRSEQRSSGYTDNAHSGHVNVGHQNILNSGYDRAGNWSEQNQYRTDGGHGQVHEERGQYVEGPRRVRFYKKNYTSSYGTGYTNGGAATTSEQLNGHTLQHQTRVPTGAYYDNSQILESQYGQTGGSQHVHQDYTYNRAQNTHVQSQRSGSHNQRLEDLGESFGNTQTAQHGVAGYDSRTSGGYGRSSGAESGNWREVNSYKTDGGRGQVFEENGQYQTGPTKVRYYKKNYTSSYSTTADHVNDSVHLQELERRMQNMMREVQSEVQHPTHGTMVSGHGAGDLQVSESVNYGQETEHGHISTDNAGHRLSQNLYVQGQPTDYTTENHSTYEQTRQSFVTKQQQPVLHATNPTANLVRVPLGGRNDYQRNIHESRLSHQQLIDEQRRAEQFNSHRSQIGHHDVAQNQYTQHTIIPSSSGHVRQYEEHWSSAGGTGNVPIPTYNGAHGNLHLGQLQYGSASHADEHNSHQSIQRHNTYVGQSNHYEPVHTTPPAKMVNGLYEIGHGQHGLECNHRVYKRSVKYGESDDMHPQEVDDLNQAGEKYDDFTQQTMGTMGFGHETQAPQRVIKIEFTPDGSYIPPEYSIPDLDNIQNQNLLNMLEEVRRTVDELQKVSSYEDLLKRNITFGHHSHESTEHHQNVMHQQHVYGHYGQHTTGSFESNNRMTDWPPVSGSVHQQSGDFAQQTSTNSMDQRAQYPYRTTTTGTMYNPHTGDFSQGNEDLTQQPGGFGDFTQQTSDNFEVGQQTQNPFKPRKPGSNDHSLDFTQQNEDLTQQAGGFDDLTQQTSGGFEFGQHTQDSYRSRKPGTGTTPHSGDLTQQDEDLTQQTGGFDGVTEQTLGSLEFGQQRQDPYRRRTPGSPKPSNSDIAQENEDLTQQTSEGLDFGQVTQDTYKPRKPVTETTPHLDDLTQQTGGFDDLTLQTPGSLEFGQQTQDPYRRRTPGSRIPSNSGITQENEDLTQQTSGGMDFGQLTQDTYRPRKPATGATPHSGDLTQQTGGFDDYTQQASDSLEFGQQTQDPYRRRTPGSRIPSNSGITQENEDLTQQTSGGMDFGQLTQDTYRPRKPATGATPHSGDLTQQTGGFDDYTQQASDSLEFGQQTQDPYRRSTQGSQGMQSSDLTQENEDLTQQTSSGTEFSQQTQNPYRTRRPATGNTPHSSDLNQQNEDLTQQTGRLDDFTQQTSVDPDFGQQMQDPYRSRRPGSQNSPQSGDLTQENKNLTQQTSSGLEFGQQTQDPYRPRKPETGYRPHSSDFGQHNDDLTQQTGGHDDFTQQTSDLELSMHPQNPYRPKIPQSQNQHQSGDLTQQTSDDFEFGHRIQGLNWTGRPANTPHSSDSYQQNEDLMQQTGGFDDFTQQSAGGLEFGQQSQDPYRQRKPGSRNPPHSGDLTQQMPTGIGFGQQTQDPYMPRRPGAGTPPYSGDLTQQSDDLTQQTGEFGSLTQQPSSNFEIGQYPQNPYRPRNPSTPQHASDISQNNEDMTQQAGNFGHFDEQTSDLEFGHQSQNPRDMNSPGQLPRRPAPKPRPRYQQRQYPNNEQKPSDNVNKPVEVDVEVDDEDVRTDQLGRGDQSLTNVKPKYDTTSTNSPQTLDNDKQATQWHYDHNPGDLTNSEPGLSGARYPSFDNSKTQQTPEEPPVEQLGVKTSRRKTHPRPQATYGSGTNVQYPADMRYPSSWPPYQHSIESGFGSSQKQSNNVDYGQVTEDMHQQQQFAPVESKVEGKVEPRILQAYGGGPYNSERDGDAFHRVTPNPSVTIPPNLEGFEPWDIREKPRDFPNAPDVPTVQPLDLSTGMEEDTTAPTEKPPGFWGRLGSRITTGFDKAKEKVRGVFG